MSYDSKCLDLAQHFLSAETVDTDEKEASLAQAIQNAVEAWFADIAISREPCLFPDEQRAQGERCGCRGTDDYCGCQNVPDAITRGLRSRAAA